MTKKRVFCDSDVLKIVLKFQICSVLKIKILCAQAWVWSTSHCHSARFQVRIDRQESLTILDISNIIKAHDYSDFARGTVLRTTNGSSRPLRLISATSFTWNTISVQSCLIRATNDSTSRGRNCPRDRWGVNPRSLMSPRSLQTGNVVCNCCCSVSSASCMLP